MTGPDATLILSLLTLRQEGESMGGERGTRDVPKGLKKDWRKLAERMRDVGWTFEQGGKHAKCFAPDGRTWTTLSGTPSDAASWRNARAAFRRWCRENDVEPGI